MGSAYAVVSYRRVYISTLYGTDLELSQDVSTDAKQRRNVHPVHVGTKREADMITDQGAMLGWMRSVTSNLTTNNITTCYSMHLSLSSSSPSLLLYASGAHAPHSLHTHENSTGGEGGRRGGERERREKERLTNLGWIV